MLDPSFSCIFFHSQGFALCKQNVRFAFVSSFRVVVSRVGRIPHFVNRNICGFVCFMLIQVVVLCGRCLRFVLHLFYNCSTFVLHFFFRMVSSFDLRNVLRCVSLVYICSTFVLHLFYICSKIVLHTSCKRSTPLFILFPAICAVLPLFTPTICLRQWYVCGQHKFVFGSNYNVSSSSRRKRGHKFVHKAEVCCVVRPVPVPPISFWGRALLPQGSTVDSVLRAHMGVCEDKPAIEAERVASERLNADTHPSAIASVSYKRTSLKDQSWVPASLRNHSLMPDSPGTLGRPWAWACLPGHFRHGPTSFPSWGVGQFLFGHHGRTYVLVFEGEHFLKLGIPLDTVVQRFNAMASQEFADLLLVAKVRQCVLQARAVV